MRLLVTRPEPDAHDLRAKLERHGHKVIISPLLEVKALPVRPLEPNNVQALIFTSRNAVRAAAASCEDDAFHALPVYAVGTATADAAKEVGFATVTTGPGDAHALLNLIIQSAQRDGGILVHLAGESLACDMVGALTQVGFRAEERPVYRTVAATNLSSDACNAVRRGKLDAVILMSPRSAETFADIAGAANLHEAVQDLIYFCISKSTADALGSLRPRQMQVAEHPNLKALISLINRISPQSVD